MKKAFLILSVFLTLGFSVNAQTDKINVSPDSSLVINGVYAGLLNSVSMSTIELAAQHNYSFRVGAVATWQMNDLLSFHATSVYDRSNEDEFTSNNFYFKVLNRSKKLSFELGHMTTAATEIRPVPASADGQFETWTEALMPGSAMGAKIGFNSDYGSLKIGVASRQKQAEYSLHASKQIKNQTFHLVFALGGPGGNNNYTVGITHKNSKIYQVLAFREQNVDIDISKTLGYFINYEIMQTQKVCAYLDAGYDFSNEISPRLEAGLIKNFESQLLKGLLALGYDAKKKSVQTYFFIHF